MAHLIDDPAHWRKRAAESRALAEQITDPSPKRRMLVVAEKFERIAWKAEAKSREQDASTR